ncbi:hypothetical protein DENSPDRAFT_86168 [Dentipellis sp. KUC8613]|nr:hypothetical protein DENSPDRAFT_86168 [Dentipellis sp. KUC8613]
MAYSHRSHDLSSRDWRHSSTHGSPTQTAHDVQRRNELPAFSSSVYNVLDSTPAHTRVEHEFVSDLQLARARPASFASSSLVNPLGNPTSHTQGAYDMANASIQQTAVGQTAPSHHGKRQSSARSSTRSSVPGSSTRQHSADMTASHEVVFSVGHDYQDQWKAEQLQPVASSSKAPRVLATTLKARAARKRRSTGAQDLYNLNKKLPDPWHRYDDPLNRRVIPKATEYIDYLEQTVTQKVKKLHDKDKQIEWFEHELETHNIKYIGLERELHQRCEEIDYLRSTLHQHDISF